MTDRLADSAGLVRVYHDRTKHHFNRYARSLGFMDWANQPDPFRQFEGCERLALDRFDVRAVPTYDSLFAEPPSEISAPLDRASISRFFQHCLALSAWKQAGPANSWSLRINPSSGALHPTEGYLICGDVPGLTETPCVFHYSPFRHALERRCDLSLAEWQTLTSELPTGSVLVGLTSIYWREAWKYGERAFRYCNHDVGHAIGAISFAARSLGWRARLLTQIRDRDLNRLLGTVQQVGPEAEHADCLLVLSPLSESTCVGELALTNELSDSLASRHWFGQPNVLSDEHHDWPIIDEVAAAIRSADDVTVLRANALPVSKAAPHLEHDRGLSAEQIIRQRRSAVDMDGETTMSREDFFRILRRTVPSLAPFPFGTWPWAARVSLALFVHRVRGLEPGLYVLVRSDAHDASLRQSFRKDFEWQRPQDCPDDLNLFLLKAADAQSAARTISCQQDIASDGVFAVGMLAEFDAALTEHGPAFYPRLFWETGLIGQVLYLEAEAAGVRGTGIGCFFDDAMHQMLGIENQTWQSLYHFTIGGPVLDIRLQTLSPYSHLETSQE